MGDVLDKAIVFAVNAHSGMRRKGSYGPYILHPLEAAAIAGTMTDDEDIISAAVLHDVLEDTPVTAEQLCDEFGERIAALVLAESENKRAERPAAETWKLRKQETVDALMSETRPEIKIIALADKLSNLRSLYAGYQKIGDQIWSRFNQKDRAEHAWYYRGIAEATKDLSAFPAWREYDALIKKLF